jgi:methylated-DNA-[protein]-cysteine S-methyltransferase
MPGRQRIVLFNWYGTEGGIIMKKIRKIIFPLDNGWGGLAATPQGLVALIPRRNLQTEVEEEFVQALPADLEEIALLTGGAFGEDDLHRLTAELNAYYRGEKVALDYPIDWETTGVTDFQKRALEACKQVAYGEWATYGDLADAVGNPKAARAIGGAMHINPVSLVVP